MIDVLAINHLAGQVSDISRNRFWFVEKPGALDWMTGTAINWEEDAE